MRNSGPPGAAGSISHPEIPVAGPEHCAAGGPPRPAAHLEGARAPASNRLERWLLRAALGACGNPPVRIVLWDGEVVPGYITTPRRDATETAAIAEYNRRLSNDPRLLTSIVPLRDGVAISLKRASA